VADNVSVDTVQCTSNDNKHSTTNSDIKDDVIRTDINNPILTDNKPTHFPTNYSGAITVLISSINKNNNLGRLHTVSMGKLFTKNFKGVISIIPAGLQQVKINFNSIKNVNTCILSPILKDNGLVANIPNSLTYCFGVVRYSALSRHQFITIGVCTDLRFTYIIIKLQSTFAYTHTVVIVVSRHRNTDKLASKLLT